MNFYVFPKGLIGLPLKREIEFYIDVVPRICLISIAPYGMTSVELKDNCKIYLTRGLSDMLYLLGMHQYCLLKRMGVCSYGLINNN